MGLRCSLAGHDWGESEIERDRDEQGSEVVLTVREYEVCTRCEDRNLISENTEVTTLASSDADGQPSGRAPEPTRGDAPPEQPPGDAPPKQPPGDAHAEQAHGDAHAEQADAVSAGDASADRETPPDEPTEPPADGAGDGAPASAGDGDDAVVIDAEADGPDVATAADIVGADADAPEAEPVAGDAGAESAPAERSPEQPAERAEQTSESAGEPAGADASGDDGVILDDEAAGAPAADDRDRGEWPEHDGSGPTGSGPSREPPAGDVDVEGFDGEPAAETAADVDATGEHGDPATADATAVDPTEPPADADAGADEDGYDAELVDDDARAAPAQDAPLDGDAPAGIKSAGSTSPPGTRHRGSGGLVCPNCGNAESANRTSLRAGDICPECKKGYLSDDA